MSKVIFILGFLCSVLMCSRLIVLATRQFLLIRRCAYPQRRRTSAGVAVMKPWGLPGIKRSEVTRCGSGTLANGLSQSA